MKKTMLTLIIGLCAFGAFAQDFTNDVAAIKAETDPAAKLVLVDAVLSYTNTAWLAEAKGGLLNKLGRYAETIELREGEESVALFQAYQKTGQYSNAYECTWAPVIGRVTAARRGGILDDEGRNALIADFYKDCKNAANFSSSGFKREYKRSIATTAEYVELLENILRVVEVNENTRNGLSWIRSELEANR